MRQRDANLTALAAIGPRKKRKVDSPGPGSGTEVRSAAALEGGQGPWEPLSAQLPGGGGQTHPTGLGASPCGSPLGYLYYVWYCKSALACGGHAGSWTFCPRGGLLAGVGPPVEGVRERAERPPGLPAPLEPLAGRRPAGRKGPLPICLSNFVSFLFCLL